MKYKAKYLCCFFLCLAFPAPLWAGWVAPPNSPPDGLLNVNQNSVALYPGIASSADAVYVAWQENSGGAYQIYVKKYNGAGWAQLGGSLNCNMNGNANRAALAVYQGNPYVAWAETNGSGKLSNIFVKHYTSAGWIQDGGSVTDANVNVDFPCLAVNGSGTPYVSWVKTDGDWTAYAKYLTGASWSATLCAFSNGIPHIVMSPDNLLWLAKTQNGGQSGMLGSFNGVAWQTQTAIQCVNTGSYDMNQMRMAFYKNVPYAAWYEYKSDAGLIYVKPGPGQIYGPLNSHEGYMPALAADDSNMFVVWYEKDADLPVKKYNGAAWDALSGNLKVNAQLKPKDPGISVFDGAPYVVWHEQDYDNPSAARVYIKTYISPTPTPVPAYSYSQPNPFLPGRGEKAVFYFKRDQPQSPTVIHILSLDGRKIRALRFQGPETPLWDGRDDSGHMCEGGLYFYQVETENRHTSGKIVLIR